jgi:pilus assembly protein Flp/PilA
MRNIIKFITDESAATAVEYAVMLAMIILAVLAAIGTVGTQTGGMWSSIVSNLRSVGFFGP